MEKHCRPIEDVISETEHKGTLIERLVNVENRVLNVCLQLEAELEMMKKKKEEENFNLKNKLDS
uniref:Putative ovule protein n=1 Tax=Solanum chacoense TaxID=4108 RepID=A0A0V0GMB2_SOLCH